MRLVERVVREVVHLVVDGRRDVLRDAVGHAAGDIAGCVAADERAALLFDVLDLLFAHGAAHHVRLPERIPGKLAEDLDDLLLIEDAAVGDGEDGLQHRVLVFDERRILLAGDQARDRFHRARPVGGDDDGQIFDRLRLQAHAHARHAGRFHLEHTGGPALREHVHDLGVVVGDAGHGEVRLGLTDIADGIVDDGDVAQAEEVHFEEPELLQRRHGVFGNDRAVVRRQRHIVIDRELGDDDARGVRRGVARHALDGLCRVDQFPDPFVRVVHLPQLRRLLQRVRQRHVRRRRHELGHRVRLGVGEVHHAADVADGAARSHGTEGDDLCDMVLAVFAPDVVDDLGAPGVTEVHIDIGHRHARRVEETLEIKPVFHGVDLGDMQAVGDHRARGAAAPGADRDPGRFGKAHEIPHDEEVIGKAHLLDHVDLIVELLHIFRVLRPVELVKALAAELLKIRKARHALRELEFRQEILAERKLHIAALRNFYCIVKRLRHIREQLAQLLFALEIEFLRLKFHAVRVVDGLAGLDAEQHVLHFRVRLAQIVCVVRHDERQRQFFGELADLCVDGPLLRDAVILQLQIKMVRPENFGILARRLLGGLQVVLHDRLRDAPSQTGRQGDQALVMLAQQLHIHARAVIKALREAERDHIAEIAVAGLVFTQEDEMVGFFVDAVDLVEARAAGDINLAADDGLDPGLLCCAVKVDRAVHDAVVGQGDGLLADLLHTVHHRADTAGAVKQTVFAVDVQMHKCHGGRSFLSSRSQAQRACACGGSLRIWKQADPAWRQAPAASPQGSPDGASPSRGAWAAGP